MNYQPLIIIAGWIILATVGFYIAWFQGDQFRKFLNWNSKIFGGGSSWGQAWLASKYYFWLMRLVTTGILILALITLVLFLINL